MKACSTARRRCKAPPGPPTSRRAPRRTPARRRASGPSRPVDGYGTTRPLSGLPVDLLKANVSGIPDNAVEGVRRGGVFLFRAYAALLYMRSDHLERRLDSLSDGASLKPF